MFGALLLALFQNVPVRGIDERLHFRECARQTAAAFCAFFMDAVPHQLVDEEKAADRKQR
jgi:hypothetical protein